MEAPYADSAIVHNRLNQSNPISRKLSAANGIGRGI
jgi:hypothetical protein